MCTKRVSTTNLYICTFFPYLKLKLQENQQIQNKTKKKNEKINMKELRTRQIIKKEEIEKDVSSRRMETEENLPYK